MRQHPVDRIANLLCVLVALGFAVMLALAGQTIASPTAPILAKDPIHVL